MPSLALSHYPSGQADLGQVIPEPPPCRAAWAEARTTVSVFGSVVAAILAVIYYGARLGFRDNFVGPVGETLGVSWFLIHFPFGYRLVRRCLRRVHGEAWCEGDAALTLCGLGFVVLWGVVAGWIGWSPVYLFAVIGATLFAYRFLRWLRAGGVLRSSLVLGSALVLALYTAGTIWGSGYQSPLFVQTLGGVGMGSSAIDTLYHAAYCNMIRTYGVPSTGLDGVPFIPYHFGSHWLFAQLCNLLNLSAIDFYNLGFPVVFIPFYLNSLLLFTINLRPARLAGEAARPPALQGNWLFWFLLLVAHIGLLPEQTGRCEAATAWDLPIVSESYSTAVAVSLLGLSAGLAFYREIRSRLQALHWQDVLVLAVVFPTLLGIVGLLKMSLMLILLAAVLCAYIRLGLYPYWRFAFFLAAAFVCSALSWRLTFNPAYRDYLGASKPFGFVRDNVAPGWLPYFFPLYFLWVWLYLFLRLREKQVRTVADLVGALKERTLVDVELLAVVALVGAIPGMLVGTQGNMSAYFSDFQQWLAWGLVAGGSLVQGAAGANPTRGRRAGIATVRLAHLFAFALGLCVVGSMLLTTGTRARQMIAHNLLARRSGRWPAAQGLERSPSKPALAQALSRGDLAAAWKIVRERAAAADRRLDKERKILTTLTAFNRWPLSEKRRTILYIPKSNRAFWGFLDQVPPEVTTVPARLRVKLVPLLGPALSGMAMIDGLPVPDPKVNWGEYGYEGYRMPAPGRRQPPLDVYAPHLCARAARMGFAQLLIVDVDRQAQIRSRLWPCDHSSEPKVIRAAGGP